MAENVWCIGDKIRILGKHEDRNRSDKEINNTILTQISFTEQPRTGWAGRAMGCEQCPPIRLSRVRNVR